MQKHLCWNLLNLFSAIFEIPANDKYTSVGSEKAKIFLLDDFRWFKDLICWYDILILLEGETVKLPVPKNSHSEDIVISTDVAISATSKSSMKHKGPYNASDDKETEIEKLPDRKTISFAINFLHQNNIYIYYELFL